MEKNVPSLTCGATNQGTIVFMELHDRIRW
jgi:hypothetical protein